jgi:hypothetical protein
MRSPHDLVTVGADPEVFVRDARGSYLPIYGQVGGTKENPTRFSPPAVYVQEGTHNCFAYQEDGAALEFNIPPSYSGGYFQYYITSAVDWLNANLLTRKRLVIDYRPEIDLQPRFLEHPLSQQIGCLHDHYAWDESLAGAGYRRKPFTAAAFGTKRFAGFHIHLAYDHSAVPQHIMAKLMDLYIGAPAVLHGDHQLGRREFYGRAGLYREKPYGIEYRTLSSRALKLERTVDSKHLTPGCLGEAAVQLGRLSYSDISRVVALYNQAPWAAVRRAIEEEDMSQAELVYSWVKEHDLRC